jgi:hypothetical protein
MFNKNLLGGVSIMEIHHTNNKAAHKWQIPGPVNVNDEKVLNGNNEKSLDENVERPLFELCPYCGKEGYHQIPGFYEHCTYCGIDRLLLSEPPSEQQE